MSDKLRKIGEVSPKRQRAFWALTGRDCGGCWDWLGSKTKRGYGQFKLGGRKGMLLQAHRVAWRITNGEPGNLHVLHKCDNTSCVNPQHLFLGTQRDNLRDAASKGRTANRALTEAKVRQILDLAAAGKSYSFLARKFGVNQSNIGSILRRRTWRHVSKDHPATVGRAERAADV